MTFIFMIGLVAYIIHNTPLLPTIGFDAPSEIEAFFEKGFHKFDISTLPDPIIPIFVSFAFFLYVTQKKSGESQNFQFSFQFAIKKQLLSKN